MTTLGQMRADIAYIQDRYVTGSGNADTYGSCVVRTYREHAPKLLALAEAVGEYIEAEQAPSEGTMAADRDRARRKVAARHEMYAKYLALEAPCDTP